MLDKNNNKPLTNHANGLLFVLGIILFVVSGGYYFGISIPRHLYTCLL